MIKWKVKYEELEGKSTLDIIMSKKDFLDDEGIRNCAFIFDLNDIDKMLEISLNHMMKGYYKMEHDNVVFVKDEING